jgi:ATP-dependent DNA helicase RecG
MRELVGAGVERAPELPEWIEPGLKAQRRLAGLARGAGAAHADPADARARERLAYDEMFANQLALMLVRGEARAKRGASRWQGDGRLRDALKLPFTPTGAQRGRSARSKATWRSPADAAAAAGRCRIGQDAGRDDGAADRGRGGRAGALLAPTEILARQHFENAAAMLGGLPVHCRDPDRARQGQGARERR